MEMIIVASVGLLWWLYYKPVLRAKRRIQRCIDNGLVDLEDGQIVIRDSVSDQDQSRIQEEIDTYINRTRDMDPYLKLKLFSLYQRNRNS